MSKLIINREWCMPSHSTFTIKPIRKLIEKYYDERLMTLNPFAYKSKYGVTNDINPELDTDFHLDANEFLEQYPENSIDLVLYDPPYTTYQLKEHYNNYPESKALYYTTKTNYWTKQKETISRIVKGGGYVICFGYDSNGIGKTRGFELIEILLVAHGGGHHDTIVTVERKINQTRLYDTF